MTGLVSDIQRFSVHDGPGIRTTAFLKGCPLRCPWCHNPETMRPVREILYYPERCIGCGRCVAVCPEHFHLDETGHHYQRATCERCLEAARGCPSGALQLSGREMRAQELVQELIRDRLFFEESGGGVTISGGEPLAQAGFVREVLSLLREQSVHTCLDTAADGVPEAARELVPLVGIFLVDCKETRPESHLQLTGRPLEPILLNLERVSHAGATIHLRCPIVPGVNEDEEHLLRAGELAQSLAGVTEVHVLPFHRAGAAKWGALGRSYRFNELEPPPAETVERWAEVIRRTTGKPVVTPPREPSGQ